MVLINGIIVIYVIYKALTDDRFGRGDADNNDGDGGIEVGDDLPDLDLPPGVDLPTAPVNEDDRVTA
jgi:hypothetical protein